MKLIVDYRGICMIINDVTNEMTNTKTTDMIKEINTALITSTTSTINNNNNDNKYKYKYKLYLNEVILLCQQILYSVLVNSSHPWISSKGTI